ncbi:hypothetical protein ACLB2K_058034 [Fragaria x ananassa]
MKVDHWSLECPYLDEIPNSENTTVGKDYEIHCRHCNKSDHGHPDGSWPGYAWKKSGFWTTPDERDSDTESDDWPLLCEVSMKPPLGPHLRFGLVAVVGGGDIGGGRVAMIEKGDAVLAEQCRRRNNRTGGKDDIVLTVTENGDVVPRLPFSSFLFYAASLKWASSPIPTVRLVCRLVRLDQDKMSALI